MLHQEGLGLTGCSTVFLVVCCVVYSPSIVTSSGDNVFTESGPTARLTCLTPPSQPNAHLAIHLNRLHTDDVRRVQPNQPPRDTQPTTTLSVGLET